MKAEVDDWLRAAVLRHREGRLDEAAALYEQVLAKSPDNADALNLLGVVNCQQGRVNDGIRVLEQAAVATARHPDVLVNLGNALEAAGRLSESLAHFREAAAGNRNDVRALEGVGRLSMALGEPSAALQAYETALRLDPGSGGAHANVADALLGLARLEEAVERYRRALSLDATLSAAGVQLAKALRRLGRAQESASVLEGVMRRSPDFLPARVALAEQMRAEGAPDRALAACRDILRDAPDDAQSNLVAGVSARQLGLHREARRFLERAVALSTQDGQALLELGTLCLEEGDLERASSLLQAACAAAPKDPHPVVQSGLALFRKGRLDLASAAFRQAIAIDDRCFEAHANLGAALSLLGRSSAAVESLARAEALQPGDLRVRATLAVALQSGARAEEAVAVLEDIWASPGAPVEAGQNYLMGLQYIEAARVEHLLAAHRRFSASRAHALGTNRARRVTRRPAGEPLRVGYLSPDFRDHSVAYFVEPLLERHDRTRVRSFAYALSGDADDYTRRLRARADEWCDAWRLDDAALAARIEADGIDVLVDLAGHTAGNRIGVLARRPAPLQVSFLGYPAPVGPPLADFWLADGFVAPDAGVWKAEPVLRLRRSYFCYRPNSAVEVAPLPAARTGFVTFGSFSSAAKIGGACLDLWASVLLAVEGSRLLLKNRSFADGEVAGRILKDLAGRGVDPSRVQILPAESRREDHLARYAQIDIALDTFPYNGATTVCEALWCGVPMVSLAGPAPASRMGLSILSAAGLGDWAVTTPANFLARATALAADLPALAAARASLQDTLRQSDLMDETAYARDFEAVLTEGFSRLCDHHEQDLAASP